MDMKRELGLRARSGRLRGARGWLMGEGSRGSGRDAGRQEFADLDRLADWRAGFGNRGGDHSGAERGEWFIFGSAGERTGREFPR